VSVIAIDYSNLTERESLIIISIENDTAVTTKYVKIQSSKGQEVTCTLQYQKCLVGISSGDTAFKIYAHMSSGEIRTGVVGYAEPGSLHSLKIGSFDSEST
jgi:hypothetical protein